MNMRIYANRLLSNMASAVKTCDQCNGTGKLESICQNCDGTGCRNCDNNGEIIVKCETCKGKGKIEEDEDE